ncbi:hypothetical protein [Pelomonas cellulosilytica]|uniref:hypothetical protein n=1 Tax=Pelomonas cellulosilytica TaxID=2906762 RepID=UPI001F42C99F
MSLWPWLAVAGAGALHGLNPCSGWALAAACGWRSRDGRDALRVLALVAAGHVMSVAAVAVAVALGLAMDRLWTLAVVVVAATALLAWRRRRRAGLLGAMAVSFTTATVQGSGLMLVPAFVPLCLSGSPAREITATGSLALALSAVAVHMAAMLVATAAMAWLGVRGVAACRAVLRPQSGHHTLRDLRCPRLPPTG